MEKEVIEYIDIVKYVDKMVSEVVDLLSFLAFGDSGIAPDLSFAQVRKRWEVPVVREKWTEVPVEVIKYKEVEVEVEKIVEVEVDEIEGKWDLMKTLKIEFGPISYSLFLRLVAFR